MSTDLTSLNFDKERLSVVVEMTIGADGSLQNFDVYRARVRDDAQLAHNSVAAWLISGDAPEAVTTVNGLAVNLHFEVEEKKPCRELIEDCMIAANGVVARYLASRNFPYI